MRRAMLEATAHRQLGWVGLVVLLLALVIVAVLAKDALQKYGLTGATGPASKATPVGQAAQDLTVAPTPGNALERARGLEGSVKQQAEDLSKRIDDASTTK